MSQLRTLQDLQDAMQRDFAWRKKELISVYSLADSNRNTQKANMCVRAGVTLLYAHFEGFVKCQCGLYLEYVARRRLRHDELNDCFLALAISREVRGASSLGSFRTCLGLVEFFRTRTSARSDIEWKAGVDTKSNVNSSVLEGILHSLGLDNSRFVTKQKLIDEVLLANRNRIAHGQHALIGFHEFSDLYYQVLGIMTDVYNQIQNAALARAFKIS